MRPNVWFVVLACAVAGSVIPCRGAAQAVAQEASEGGPALTGHWAFRWTRLYEDGARLAGGGIGLTFGDRCRLELVGFGTASPSRYGSLEFRVAYGGIRLERALWRSGRFSTSGALFGGGGSFSTTEGHTGVEERTGIAVVEPEILQGFDLGSHARLAITGSYRWVTGIEGDILNRSDGDARGFAAGAHLSVR